LLHGDGQVRLQYVAMSFALVLAVLAGGLWYFRRNERTFADVI